MRLIESFCAAALCLAPAAEAHASQASGPIPVRAETLPFNAPVEGQVTSADNRFGDMLFDCFNLTRPADTPGIDLMFESVGEQVITAALLEGHGCEVAEDSVFQDIPPKRHIKEKIFSEMSLLIGSRTPVRYKLNTAAATRDKSCIVRRGSRELVSDHIWYTTLKGNPELVPVFLPSGGKPVLHTPADFPAARSLDWYVNNEPIAIGSVTYAKYGLPRVIGADEVEYLAEKDGVFIGKEKGRADAEVEVVYVMVDQAGCEFQPYQKTVGD